MILCQTCVWRDPCAYHKIAYPKATQCDEFIPEHDHIVENLDEYEDPSITFRPAGSAPDRQGL